MASTLREGRGQCQTLLDGWCHTKLEHATVVTELGCQLDYAWSQLKLTKLVTPVKDFLDWITRGGRTHMEEGSFCFCLVALILTVEFIYPVAFILTVKFIYPVANTFCH